MKTWSIIFLSVCFFVAFPQLSHSSDIKDKQMQKQRFEMVDRQIAGRDVKDKKVLEAMKSVKRHIFVPTDQIKQAYKDHPLPIGHDQTISQPYIVGKMTELLKLKGDEKVLEIGTGSGYQAAVLSRLSKQVYSIEIVEPLCNQAKSLLESLDYKNITIACRDGYKGWQEFAPFDAIMVTAAPNHIPKPLIEQLKPGGKLVIPVGSNHQELLLVTKNQNGKIEKKSVFPVRFVPMTGEALRK